MTYATLGAIDTWYTEAGSGTPLVLLHGGMSDGRGWGMQVPAFSGHYRVLVPDRRGHGQTHDTDAPFGYEAMAAETIAFLETVVGGPARVVGWSDGGVVALLVARARPDLVVRQVLMGTNFHHDGLLSAFELDDDPDADDAAIFKAMYESGSVDGPEHWPAFLAKTNRMWREEPTLSEADLTSIDVPTLVLAGDDEPIALAHTAALYESLPHAQLAVVPGASHVLALEKPELVNQLILDFLAEEHEPTTLMPIRRADTTP